MSGYYGFHILFLSSICCVVENEINALYNGMT